MMLVRIALLETAAQSPAAGPELDPSDEPVLGVNGARVIPHIESGYAVIRRQWRAGNVITLDLPLRIHRVVADNRVAADQGKVAIERGPIVYCAEAVDNEGSVLDLVLPDTARLKPLERPDLLGGIVALEGNVRSRSGRARRLFAVPYAVWANRELGEMTVWVPRA